MKTQNQANPTQCYTTIPQTHLHFHKTQHKNKLPEAQRMKEKKNALFHISCKEEMGRVTKFNNISPFFHLLVFLETSEKTPIQNPSPTTRKPSNVPRINHLFAPYKNQSFNRDQQKEEKQSKTLGHCSLRSVFLSISRERREVSRDLPANREKREKQREKKKREKARVKKTALKRPFYRRTLPLGSLSSLFNPTPG